jgi:hypothetical protein
MAKLESFGGVDIFYVFWVANTGNVVAEDHDKDLSGDRADNRPVLQSAIAAATALQ